MLLGAFGTAAEVVIALESLGVPGRGGMEGSLHGRARLIVHIVSRRPRPGWGSSGSCGCGCCGCCCYRSVCLCRSLVRGVSLAVVLAVASCSTSGQDCTRAGGWACPRLRRLRSGRPYISPPPWPVSLRIEAEVRLGLNTCAVLYGQGRLAARSS